MLMSKIHGICVQSFPRDLEFDMRLTAARTFTAEWAALLSSSLKSYDREFDKQCYDGKSFEISR